MLNPVMSKSSLGCEFSECALIGATVSTPLNDIMELLDGVADVLPNVTV
jgi:hypothetical protein